MSKFEFQEVSTWVIEAEDVGAAYRLWQDYRLNNSVTDSFELVDGSGWFVGEFEEV